MVAPIAGPFTRTEIAKGTPTNTGFKPDWLWYSRTWYRQRRPYNLPLSFTYKRGQVVKWWSYDNTTYLTYASSGSILNDAISPTTTGPAAYNRAYGKFKSMAMPDSASLGIALAQRKQAIEMISGRALQLALFAKQLRAGQFHRAAGTIGLTAPPRSWQKKSKTFGDRFLEVHFGWSPLIGDIGSAVDVLQGGVPPSRIRASGTTTSAVRIDSPTGSRPVWIRSGQDKITWIIGADVKVDNPNLMLANSLGFVNPASVLWDAVPFSFVVGWFVNVDQFLGSFTDFHGMSLLNPYTTCHWERSLNAKQYQVNWPTQGVTTLYTNSDHHWVRTARTPGPIPGPSLRFKEPWILSPTRAITAVSLLLQRLR